MNDLFKTFQSGLLTALVGLASWIGIETKNDIRKMSESIIALNERIAVIMGDRKVDEKILQQHEKQISIIEEDLKRFRRGQ
jgi:hypothetical protein